MTAPWTERDEPGVLSIEFQGVDTERKDALELKRFKDALSTPAAESEVRVDIGSPLLRHLFFRGTSVSSLDPMRLALLAVGVFLACSVCTGVRFVAALYEIALPLELQASLFLGCCLLPMAVVALRNMPRRVKARLEPTDRFTLRLRPSSLTVTGRTTPSRTFELGDVARFEGARRITLVMNDGRRQELPCALPTMADHPALAARLQDAWVAAVVAAGGYRGVPVHARIAAGDAERETPDGADAAAEEPLDRTRGRA